MSKISIVVPVYYNSDTLMMLYEDMKEKILGKLGDYELVFVDDGSKDKTVEEVKKLRQKDERVHLVSFSRIFQDFVQS